MPRLYKQGPSTCYTRLYYTSANRSATAYCGGGCGGGGGDDDDDDDENDDDHDHDNHDDDDDDDDNDDVFSVALWLPNSTPSRVVPFSYSLIYIYIYIS